MKKHLLHAVPLFAILLAVATGLSAQTADAPPTELDRLKKKAEEEQKDKEVETILIGEGDGKTAEGGSWFSFFSKDSDSRSTEKNDPAIPLREDEETVKKRKRLQEIEEELGKTTEDANRIQAEMHEIRVRLIKEDKELGELHRKIVALHRELAVKIDRTREMRPLVGDILGLDAKRKELEIERNRLQREIENKKTEK
jgi:chromosome segregation ATPase